MGFDRICLTLSEYPWISVSKVIAIEMPARSGGGHTLKLPVAQLAMLEKINAHVFLE